MHWARLCFDVAKNFQPEYLYRKLTFRYNNRSLQVRHTGLLTIPKHHTAIFQCSFSYIFAKIYNSIINYIIAFSSVKLFIKHIKTLILCNKLEVPIQKI